MVMAVIPIDCLEDGSFIKSLISISYITIRIKMLSKTETIEAKIEQRSRTNVDTIKSVCYKLLEFLHMIHFFSLLVFNILYRRTIKCN